MLQPHFPIELQRIGYREKGTEYRYAPHRLENYQWYCVLYGTVDMLIDDEKHVLNAEESILIPPGALRSPRSRERAPGYLWAHFGNRRLNLEAVTRRVLPTPLELQQDLHALVTEVQQPADGNADDLIGALPETWNWLEGWSAKPAHGHPKVVHYTRGGPWFGGCRQVEYASLWLAERTRMELAQATSDELAAAPAADREAKGTPMARVA